MEGKPLREVTIKIGLERLDTQEGITVEALLDSGATGLVMSSEFARKKGFKLKKLERPMQVRNVDGSFNREGPIENTVEVNVYYKGAIEKGVYSAVKVTTDGASILCREEGWEEEDGTRLPIFE